MFFWCCFLDCDPKNLRSKMRMRIESWETKMPNNVACLIWWFLSSFAVMILHHYLSRPYLSITMAGNLCLLSTTFGLCVCVFFTSRLPPRTITNFIWLIYSGYSCVKWLTNTKRFSARALIVIIHRNDNAQKLYWTQFLAALWMIARG